MWFYFFLLLLLSFNVRNLLVFLLFYFFLILFISSVCVSCMRVIVQRVNFFHFSIQIQFFLFFFFFFKKKKKQNFLASMCFGVSKVCHFFLLFFFFQRLYIIYKNVNQIIVGDDSFFWIESNNFQSICFGYRKILIFFFFSFLFFSNTANDVHYKHNTEFPANLLEYVLIELIFARLKIFFFFPPFYFDFFNVVPCYTSHWQQPVTSLIDCQFHPPNLFFFFV